MKIDGYSDKQKKLLLERYPHLAGIFKLGTCKLNTEVSPLVYPWTSFEQLQSILYNIIVFNHLNPFDL